MRPPLIPQPVPIHEHDPKFIRTLKLCYNHLVEYREPKTQRIIISLFMCLPSRKDFAKYFEIIKRPISMYEIRKRIEQNVYKCEEDCLSDFKQMFNNCRYFNEDESQIFKDAVKLEDMLLKKHQQLKRENGGHDGGSNGQLSSKHHNQLQHQSQHHINHHASNSNGTIPSDLESNNSNSNISFNTANTNTHHHHQQQQQQQQQHQQDQHPNIITNNHNFNEDSISTFASVASPSNDSLAPKSASKRVKRDPDAPKRRLLTGYIIYAAEVRKEYVDKNPNQDFGFISRLIGNDWKALPADLKKAYEQRAIVHNKKMREKYLRDSMLEATPDAHILSSTPHHSSSTLLTNGMGGGDGGGGGPETPISTSKKTPRMTKKKLAKLAREQARMNKNGTSTSLYTNNFDNPFSSPLRHQDGRPSHQMPPQLGGHQQNQSTSSRYSAQQANLGQQSYGKTMTTETATQTAPIRFVEPSTKPRFVHQESLRRYIEGLEVPNLDLLAEETFVPPNERPEPITKCLGAGTGRFESSEAALWALRDFMLHDSGTMRWNLQPYL